MLAGAMLFNGGCTSGLTTSLVWRIKAYHPAEMPRLNLATSTQKNDVLVQYDECFAKSSTLRPRAYWLLEYAAKDTNSMNRPKPEFVNLADYTNLCVVPMVKPREAIPTNGYCVLPTANQLAFTLWRNGTELGNYNLPVYFNAPPVTFWRVALTPVTVAADTAIVIGVVGGSAGGGVGGCGR